jgi:hypothetical protein
VRDEENGSRKRLERRLEGLAALEVEVIRRLVEDEQVGPGRDEDGQREPSPFPAGERGHRLRMRLPAGEEEPPEKRLRLGSVEARRPLSALEGAAALVEVDGVLREVADLHPVAELEASGDEILEEGRLAAPVRPDQRHPLAALECKGSVADENAPTRLHVRSLDLEHDPAASLRLPEREAEPARTARQERVLPRRAITLLLEPGDLRQLRLGLLGLGLLVTEALDEALQPRNVLRHPCGRLLRVECTFRLFPPPHVPGAAEEGRTAGLELQRCGRDRLEEPPVVRDDDDCGVELDELALEPLETGDVEMVRRLVEEQEVGISGQGPGQRGTGELSSGEARERAVEVSRREAEPSGCSGGVVAPTVAPGLLEPRLRPGIAAQRLSIVRAGRHRLLEGPQLRFEGEELNRGRQHVLTQCEVLVERRSLVVQRDARALRERELAAVRLQLARENSQERRLARAVWAHQGHPLSALDLEADAVEERIAGDLLAKRRGDDDSHGAAAGYLETAAGAATRRRAASAIASASIPAAASSSAGFPEVGISRTARSSTRKPSSRSASAARTASPSPPSGQ